MGQTAKVSKNNTTISTEGKYIVVTLHSTKIVKFVPGDITLDSGGWNTVTTKTRMNQVSNEYNLGYGVFQKDGQWWVNWNGSDIKFFDGIVLTLT